MKKRVIDEILRAYREVKPRIPDDMPGNYVPQLLCRFELKDLRDLEHAMTLYDEVVTDKA